jgi:isopentenyl phosphate kinase
VPTVLKLGGSVLTDKDRPETLDEQAIERAASAIAAADEELVVVHGGGSFGHHHADRHGVTATEGTRDARAVTDVHDAMVALNGAVVASLQTAGVSAVPVRPLSLARRTSDGELRIAGEPVAAMLAEGFVPIVHADPVVQADAGATILSGDELVVAFAERLGAARVGLCTGVPGVLDADGTVVDRIESFEAVADALGESDATDVTGGMAAKVRTLLSLSAPASVFGADALAAFLDGGTPGTLIDGQG